MHYPPTTTDWAPIAAQVRDGQAGPGHQQRPRRRHGQPAAGDEAARLPAADDVQPVPGARPAARPRARQRGHAVGVASSSRTRRADKLGGDVQAIVDDFKARATAAKLPYPVFETQAAASWNAWEILAAGVKARRLARPEGDLRLPARQRARTRRSAGKLAFDPADTTSGRRTSGIKQIQNGEWVMVWPAGPGRRRAQGCRGYRPGDRPTPHARGARAASRTLDGRSMIAVQAALTGALIGGLYALMAAGLSVTWGVLRVINLAHFGLILLGAYLTYQLATAWRLDPILTVAGHRAGAVRRRGGRCSGPTTGCSIAEFNSLLVSFGLLIIVIQVATTDLDAPTSGGCPTTSTRTRPGRWTIGRLVFPTTTLLAFGLRGRARRRRCTWCCGGPSSAGACGRSPRTGRSRPRSGSTTAGSAWCSAGWPGPARPWPAWSSRWPTALTPTTAYEWFGIVFAVVILGGIGHVCSARSSPASAVGVVSGGRVGGLVAGDRAVRAVLGDHAGAAAAPAGPVRAACGGQGRPVRRYAGFVLAFLLPGRASGCGAGTSACPRSSVRSAITVLFWIAQATSWNMLSGYSGYFSFGQAAYVGIGAYTMAVLTGRHGVSLPGHVPLARPARRAAGAARRRGRVPAAVACAGRSSRCSPWPCRSSWPRSRRINRTSTAARAPRPAAGVTGLDRRLPAPAVPARPGGGRSARSRSRCAMQHGPGSAGGWPRSTTPRTSAEVLACHVPATR